MAAILSRPQCDKTHSASQMGMTCCNWTLHKMPAGERFKNAYELLNLKALEYSHVNKMQIFQCVGNIFCVEFQRYPLKFHTKYLTHTLKILFLYDVQLLRALGFKGSYEFLKRPPGVFEGLGRCQREIIRDTVGDWSFLMNETKPYHWETFRQC